jgi:hypothetical protein
MVKHNPFPKEWNELHWFLYRASLIIVQIHADLWVELKLELVMNMYCQVSLRVDSESCLCKMASLV